MLGEMKKLIAATLFLCAVLAIGLSAPTPGQSKAAVVEFFESAKNTRRLAPNKQP